MSPSPHDRSSTTHFFDSTEENFTTSLMGIDVTGSQAEERTALLDSDSRVHYSGTTTPTRMCFSSCLGDFSALPPSYVSPFFCSFSQRSERRLLTNAFAGPDPGTDLSVLAKRARYYIPSLAWIPNYSFSLSVFIRFDSSHSFLC